MKNKKKNKHMATSKLMGLIVAIAVIAIVIYAMVILPLLAHESIMSGISPDYSPLNTLIGGIIGLATAYICFYINMAKSEHIEDKKKEIALEIKRIEQNGVTVEEEEKLQKFKEELEELHGDLEEIQSEKIDIDIKNFL